MNQDKYIHVVNRDIYIHALCPSLSYLRIYILGQWCPRTQVHHLIISAGSAKGTYNLFIQLNQLQMCVCFFLLSAHSLVCTFMTSSLCFLPPSTRSSDKHWEAASAPCGSGRSSRHPAQLSQGCAFLLPHGKGSANEADLSLWEVRGKESFLSPTEPRAPSLLHQLGMCWQCWVPRGRSPPHGTVRCSASFWVLNSY